MKILHILNHIQEIGNGIVNVAVDLACQQSQAGHQVAVVSAGGEYCDLLKSYGVQCYYLDQSKMPLKLIMAARQYRSIIRDFEPEIVHAHMITGCILASILRQGFEYKLVSTVHNEFQRSAALLGIADRVIAVSAAVKESMIRRGIPKQKLVVILNGPLGSPRMASSKTLKPLSLCRPAIATVAGMYFRKGIRELIDAFSSIAADFPDLNLYLIGDGPDAAALKAQAEQTGFSDRIHFEGFQSEPRQYLLSVDIFVLPSYSETFGLALIEARSVGCAVVASDVGGIPEALNNGQAGLLVPPKSSSQLAETCRSLLQNPGQLAKWQSRAAQNLEHFHVHRVSDETMSLYESLVTQCAYASGKLQMGAGLESFTGNFQDMKPL